MGQVATLEPNLVATLVTMQASALTFRNLGFFSNQNMLIMHKSEK